MELNNRTPKKYYCIGGLGCPAVYRTDAGSVIIVGKRLAAEDPKLGGSVRKAPDEEIIEIPSDLLSNLSG